MKGMFNHDTSGMDTGDKVGGVPHDDISDSKVGDDVADVERASIPVHCLNLEDFRKRLIEHFDILWKQNRIKWRSRTRSQAPASIVERLVEVELPQEIVS